MSIQIQQSLTVTDLAGNVVPITAEEGSALGALTEALSAVEKHFKLEASGNKLIAIHSSGKSIVVNVNMGYTAIRALF